MLEDSDFEVLQAVASRYLPPGPGPTSAEVAERIGRFYHQAGSKEMGKLKIVLRVVEWLPILTGRFKRFPRLAVGEQERFLERLERLRIAKLLRLRKELASLRALCLANYYSDARVHESLQITSMRDDEGEEDDG